ncbi:MAG TPA: DUF6174 domain-containing protein [Acidimicrobiia bacterium]|nr:DUF6174 domain-containing protein [Acidimicrobiia bacterium]
MNRRARTVVLALTLAVLLSGCMNEAGSGSTTITAGFVADLETAKTLWETAGITEYSLTVRNECPTCLFETVGPFEVEVSNGEVVEVRYEGYPIEPKPGITPIELFTVERLHQWIGSLRNAYRVEVVYDERGVPTLIDSDFASDVAGDESKITVTLTPASLSDN